MAKINLKIILLLVFSNSLLILILPKLSTFISIKLHNSYSLGLFNLTAIYSLLLVILLILILKFTTNEKSSFFGFKSLNKNNLKLAFYALFFLFPVPLIGRILDPSFDSWYTSSYNLSSFLALIYFLINLPLFIIKEELIERSLIQNYLSKFYKSAVVILVISINFALLHFFLIPNTIYHSVITVISVFLGSLVISSLYEKTKNVFLTIIVHLLYNFIVFYQIILHNNNNLFGESILFITWAILFLITFKSFFKEIKPLFSKSPQKLNSYDIIFLIIFSLLPILFLYLQRFL